MARYTVNLSRAKNYSRKRRAQKAMVILREELEDRQGGEVLISPEVNKKIWERGAENPPSKIEVEVKESAGETVAVLPGTEVEDAEEKEQEVSEEETGEEDSAGEEGEEEAGESGVDYEEIVSGTVSEAKEAVKQLDDPDYDRLLELEREGKDRKTLKEWLENRG